MGRRTTIDILGGMLVLCLVSTTFAQTDPAADPGLVDTPTESTVALQVLRPLEVGDVGEPVDDPAVDGGGLPGEENPLATIELDDASAPESGHQWWRLVPSASFGTTYDDNIFISNTDRQADVIFGVQAGLSLELGDFRNLQENYLIAQYSGTGYFYVEHPDQDAFNQAASLLAQYRIAKTTLQAESRFQYLTGSDRNVGNFANRSVIENTARAIYDFSEKTSVDLEFFQGAYVYPQYLSQYDYRLKAGANYQLTGRISLGLEGVAGVLNLEDSPLQYYQQLRVRARYEATGKVAFKFSGGIEFREFENGAQPLRVNPVFSLGTEYKPFDGTTFNLEAYAQSYGSTNFAGQNYLATGVSASVEQRLFRKFFAGFAISYENDTYYAAASNVDATRRDNFLDLRPSLDYRPMDWLSAGIFYEFRNNASTFSNYSFYDNRTGFEVGVQF